MKVSFRWISLLALLLMSFHALTSTKTSRHFLNYSEVIPDSRCRYESVNRAAANVMAPILNDLVNTTFFKYFLVNLEKPCPFWHEEGFCVMKDCAVCVCDENEVPSSWMSYGMAQIKHERLITESYGNDPLGQVVLSTNGHPSKNVSSHDRFIQANKAQKSSSGLFQHLFRTEDCENFLEWTDISSPISENGVYVNLQHNPERYTGYRGEAAHRVWSAIKDGNYFGNETDSCFERRVFYRLMSGLQSSITTHIAREYLFDDGHWGPNHQLFLDRVGMFPERMNNMYFTFLFLLRATVKGEPYLRHFHYDTGNKIEDLHTKELVGSLLHGAISSHEEQQESSCDIPQQSSKVVEYVDAIRECANGFDESTLFQPHDESWGYGLDRFRHEKLALKEDFRTKFRNISSIMDCVGCEKCRLWGKLQILGIGTAVKILLTPRDEQLHLNRQEVIALINTLRQFAVSIDFATVVDTQNTLANGESATCA